MNKGTTSVSDCSARAATWDAAGLDDEKAASASERASLPVVKRGYLPALDGLRGLAILLVVFYHCSELLELSGLSNPFDISIWKSFQLGWVGVDLFFVLSGFLITGILIEAKSRPKYFSTFYARRTLRIFPLYYVMVIATFTLFPLVAGIIASQSDSAAEKLAELPSLSGKLGWYLLYGSNFLAAIEGNMGHRMLAVTWSLAIEEQFYLVWPFVVYFVKVRTTLILSCAMVVLAFVIRCGLVWASREGYWEGDRTALYVWPFCRMDSLAIGAVIAVLWRQPGSIAPLTKLAKWILICGVPVFLLSLISGRYGNRDGIVQTFGYSFLALFFGAVLVQALVLRKESMSFRFLTHPAILQYGKFAYAIYLFHVPIMFALYALVFEKILDKPVMGSLMPSLLFYVLVVATSVFLAAKVSWITVERPFLKLKRFFPSESDKVSEQRET